MLQILGKVKFFLALLHKFVTLTFMKIPTMFFGIAFFSIVSIAGAATHVVKSGDNLYRIAKNYGISVKQLEQANPQVSPNSLRIGAKLVIPSKTESSVPAATSSSPSKQSVSIAGNYQVKAGDNLSKIARAQGTTVPALQAANPGLNPNKMAIGQKILIPGSSSASSASIAENTAPAPAPVKQPTTSEFSAETAPAPAPAPVQEQTQTLAKETPAPEKDVMPAPAPALTQNDTQTVKNTSAETAAQPAATTYRLIKTTRELTLADVAKEHNTTPEKINALNGWSFSPQTLLAVDSELYIPAQP
jgi:LysM repeat protein